jgi:2-octaprenylphenol hydroxylase
MAYERDRQRAVVPVMWATDMFKRLFSTSDPLVTAVRGLGMSSTNVIAPLKQKIMKVAMGGV